ncbi:gamma-glutamylcyclotransferase [Limnospira fusiformis SAG 85.79]|uniref:AIG2 family protein n=1 Tax=Limnospira maxima CS-328 TaxID=513049 RepID=B5W8R5_LIMMA|nr:AIG2 family protein [Limnospira maxima CS-328]EKD09413.1 AIG2 family protein [Arthrospira platensis C1]MBD2668183.1 gamma-glutamylcyclotransferase [Arthrospira platensis FACHB-439]QJB24771.1 gamma-glutamylcyclotransferase [Limnospira fusiformis SAG 85.79]QNH57058.1 MAG: gamma-glutamylcyclotransferase [Limnospira indica BM01]
MHFAKIRGCHLGREEVTLNSDTDTIQSIDPIQWDEKFISTSHAEPSFYYFAYGSCMCPVDLQRTLGEPTHSYVIGPATLRGYRLGFYRHSRRRNCGALDIVKDANSSVEGVLYRLPWRLSDRLDEREEVKIDPDKQVHIGGYRPEMIDVHSQGKDYQNVRTYMVINKLTQELAPNDWYFNVVLRGAVTCGLTQEYCWQLFNHMYNLQRQQVNYQNS